MSVNSWRPGLAAWGIFIASALAVRADSSAPASSLTVGVAQLALEPELAQNRDKIAGFVRRAQEWGCRVVVFPETGLYWPEGTPRRDVDAAVAQLQAVVRDAGVYALVGGPYQYHPDGRIFERLLVIDPDGKIIRNQTKLGGPGASEAPGAFEIDGVPCAASICADRWTRSVEELPAMAGAKVLFEISNNFDNEWIPNLGWYWYVPRALRNDVHVVLANTARENRAQPWSGHGHSAVIAPDGTIMASAGEESDKLLVVEIDLSKATGDEARRRRDHPLFHTFWDTGVSLLGERAAHLPEARGQRSAGGNEEAISSEKARDNETLFEDEALISSEVNLKIAAAQIACSRDIGANVAKMVERIREAAAEKADVVVFPELAVTGARRADILAATQDELAQALATLQSAAKQAAIFVACGLPSFEAGQRHNTAVVIDSRGHIVTQYSQIVVDRPELFAAGASTQAMWFAIKGVPGVITIGGDALWSEIAELAAVRGAQVHLHLCYDRNTSTEAALRRNQLWANLASFRTFTATVNAASSEGVAHPSAPACGGSAIWDDFRRGQRGHPSGSPLRTYSAKRAAQAGPQETMLYAARTIPAQNPHSRRLAEITTPPMAPWYAAGMRSIDSAVPDARRVGRRDSVSE